MELESTFIELINTKKSSVIIGAIYRHPNMDLDECNDSYLAMALVNDFNVDLLKYDHRTQINEFLDSLYSHFVLTTHYTTNYSNQQF